jgi:hypothetical protein
MKKWAEDWAKSKHINDKLQARIEEQNHKVERKASRKSLGSGGGSVRKSNSNSSRARSMVV